MNRLIWLGVLLVQYISPFPAQAKEGDHSLAQFPRLGLHVDSHRSFYQPPLVEIVEANENESSSCEGDGEDGPPEGQSALSANYVLPALNPLNLQRIHLLLYRLHENFRL